MDEGVGGDLYSTVMLGAVVLWFRVVERLKPSERSAGGGVS
jgi:hypothetical protein